MGTDAFPSTGFPLHGELDPVSSPINLSLPEMRSFAFATSLAVVLMTHQTFAAPKPGMLTWVCKSCPNPNMLYKAEAEMLSSSGSPVGQLKLQQSVPRDESSTEVFPLQVDTADNRIKMKNMKTSYFQVQIQTGSCDNLGEVLVSQYCRGCTNSLGVSLVGKDGKALALSEMIGHSVVFFDSKNTNTKLACGEIKNGVQLENA